MVGSLDPHSLLSKLELDEKLKLLAGMNAWETFPIERLNIPSLKVSDGPNGARGSGFYDGTTAACFPASVSLASTFNRSLARRVGKALGQETQTKGAYVLLGPTVCLHRSPLGGRNFESFSEDPLLAGVLASEYVKGLQSERVAATVKHFLANEQETRRFVVNETISNRALRELYMKPFEIIVKDADPWCIMSCYQKVNGAYVDAVPTYIQDVLRKQWGYKGLLMSDWCSTSNHVESVKYGLDLEMPGPAFRRKPELVKQAVEAGLVTEAEIDTSILRYLELLKKLGKFDDRVTTPAEQAISNPEHEALIREAGAEGIVLLKNTERSLPLDTQKLEKKKIALIGPLAKYAAAHGGGSASLNAHYKISPYDALQKRLGSEVEITYSKGTHIFAMLPEISTGTINKNGKPGFFGEFFPSPNCEGEVMHSEEFAKSFIMSLLNDKIDQGKARSLRANTTYTPAESGKHFLGFSSTGVSKLFINGQLVQEQGSDTHDVQSYFLGSAKEARFQYEFVAGQSYDVKIETNATISDTEDISLLLYSVSFRLGLVTQAEMEADLQAEAVALAKEADAVICFVGNTTQWETEGRDMDSMSLPADGSQDDLVKAVAAVQSNTIIVVTTGVAIEMPWIDNVQAVLQGWYAGQESGNAITDVLLGEVNPSGKLPISWPKKYEHTACYGHFGMDSFESKQVEYVDGVFMGYRHFDKTYGTDKEVLFPFGYGLSYSTFEVSNVSVDGSVSETDSKATVTANVKNTSNRAGAETVQVYLAPPKGSSNDRPLKSLVGFDKLTLQPGETKQISVTFERDAAAYWDDKSESQNGQRWRVEAGDHTILVATSSGPQDVKGQAVFDIKAAMEFSA